MVLVFVSVMSFVFAPISNSVSRSMERACDKYGMDMSGVSGETAAIAFDKLSVFNLSDPDPHPIIEFWFYSHPGAEQAHGLRAKLQAVGGGSTRRNEVGQVRLRFRTCHTLRVSFRFAPDWVAHPLGGFLIVLERFTT